MTSTPSPGAPAVTARQAPSRPPLVRPRHGRVIGGVCLGLANHLGLPVTTVRIVLAASTLAGGFGPGLYVWLWAFTPVEQTPGSGAAVPGSPRTAPPPFPAAPFPAPGTVRPGAGPAPGVPPEPRYARRGRLAALLAEGRGTAATVATPTVPPGVVPPGAVPPGVVPPGVVPPGGEGGAAPRVPGVRGVLGGRGGDLLIGAVLLVVGLLLLGERLGYAVRLGVLLPLIVVVGGAALAFTQLDEVERERWALRTGVGGTRAAALRVAGGLTLVLTGTLTFLLQSADVVTAARAVIAVLAVLAGTALVLAPWGVRMWRDLDQERAARIREAERADLAAHLHDSVLQTLSLIQRNSGDQAAVTRLARSQERDLRDWLYGPRQAEGGTLASEVRATAADVEDRHGVAVEVVIVGDQPVDERVAALVAALREAIVNAVRHAGAPVQVYVESGPDAVEAFVRDRGPGFDPAAVPADRLGVRESIIARMQRHGGSAAVRSDPGEGTEVRLVLPVTVPAPGQSGPGQSGPGQSGPGQSGPGAGRGTGWDPVTDSPAPQEGWTR